MHKWPIISDPGGITYMQSVCASVHINILIANTFNKLEENRSAKICISLQNKISLITSLNKRYIIFVFR